jgi:hypothetical protein
MADRLRHAGGTQSGAAVGVALALQARDKDSAMALLRVEAPWLEGFPRVEVHDWEFGRRR